MRALPRREKCCCAWRESEGSMKLFSIEPDHTILCDTPRCFAEVRRLAANEILSAHGSAPSEVAICVVEGEMWIEVAGSAPSMRVGAMEFIQIPAGHSWRAKMGAKGGKVLRVDSFHPQFAPAQRLMPALEQPHHLAIADGQMLIYTDYVRGGVLNFAPGFIADKHFHQDADEIFWFFAGECRVETPDGLVLAPAGTIVYTEPGEWHIIENPANQPLLMFLTVTPNLVPSHTFFDAAGKPWVRSWEPLRSR